MAVSLVSLTFNHDPTSARTSAINLRQDGEHFARIPEWRAGDIVSFPAAYSILDTAGARLEIVADLAGSAHARFDVRAVPPAGAVSHVLGGSDIVGVELGPDGTRRGVRFGLPQAVLALSGVGAHNVAFSWQMRASAAHAWQPFATTFHRIYSLLRLPSAPWSQHPFVPANTQLPWVEVLEWACLWASFSRTPGEAATAIALAVNRLGSAGFSYDCQGGAPTNYSYPEFDCTSFLERLAGGFGRGARVNCTDCATIVSTFANAVGADLWQARMFNQIVPFQCNPMRLIGHFFFVPVCGAGIFNYHEVAWEAACTEFDDVYDACVEVLAPPPPAFSFVPYVPRDVAFGWAHGGSSYRELLVAPHSRPLCQAQPESRQRRLVY